MTFSVQHESRGYRLQWQDGWSMEALRQALDSVRAQPEFRHCRVLIHDLAQAGAATTDAASAQTGVAELLGSHFRTGKLFHALVCTDADTAAAYAQPFGQAQIDLELFSSYHDARVWADASTGFSDLMDSMLFEDDP